MMFYSSANDSLGVIMTREVLKILFLSSEITPFAKSGDLADMAGSLPLELKRFGADVRWSYLSTVQ